MELSELDVHGKYNYEISIKGTSFSNSWDFWVYPETMPEQILGQMYMLPIISTERLRILLAEGW
ncbi:MAG: hypothetical protein MZV64_05345 [Ignavibacteriales bacterium]|nr:hypothetical protein [Ignavibacteriales bacterium]